VTIVCVKFCRLGDVLRKARDLTARHSNKLAITLLCDYITCLFECRET